jgi:predicted transcriptional regulator
MELVSTRLGDYIISLGVSGMEEKTRYMLRELFNNLPISLAELSRRSRVNEVTIARIRDGESIAQRSTANRLLLVFSEVYGRKLTLDNVDFPVRG